MLTTRRDDGDIVQEGVDVNGTRFRWVFSSISENGFVFCAEEAREGFGDWKKLAELTAKRKS